MGSCGDATIGQELRRLNPSDQRPSRAKPESEHKPTAVTTVFVPAHGAAGRAMVPYEMLTEASARRWCRSQKRSAMAEASSVACPPSKVVPFTVPSTTTSPT